MLQTADEDLLKFAKEREWRVFRFFHILVNFFEIKIPVMVVFTKYDVLFNEHYRDCLRDKLLINYPRLR